MTPLRTALTKIAWSHYAPYANDVPINVEEMLDEMMPVIEARVGEVVGRFADECPQVDTGFNDGGDEEYSSRRISVDSARRGGYFRALTDLKNNLKSL